MVENISGGFRVSGHSLDTLSDTAVSTLLTHVRADPRYAQDRARFEFRAVQTGNGAFLELKRQTAFGRFKEAVGWGAERRERERGQALQLLARAFDNMLPDSVAIAMSANRLGAASRAAAAYAGKVHDAPGGIAGHLEQWDEQSSWSDPNGASDDVWDGNTYRPDKGLSFESREKGSSGGQGEASARQPEAASSDEWQPYSPDAWDEATIPAREPDSSDGWQNYSAEEWERGAASSPQPKPGASASRAGPVIGATAAAPVRGAGIPSDAQVSDVTQLAGTTTCWALSTLMGCMELQGGRGRLDPQFVRVDDGYQLRLNGRDPLQITHAQIEAGRPGKILGQYRDPRPAWVCAFEELAKAAGRAGYLGQGYSPTSLNQPELLIEALGFYSDRPNEMDPGDSGEDDIDALRARIQTTAARGDVVIGYSRSQHHTLVAQFDEDGVVERNQMGAKSENEPFQPMQRTELYTWADFAESMKFKGGVPANLFFMSLTPPAPVIPPPPATNTPPPRSPRT